MPGELAIPIRSDTTQLDLLAALRDHPAIGLPAGLAEAVAPLLLTSRDAARVLAVSPRTLWGLTDSGELPCVRLGRSVRYAIADLTAYVNRLRAASQGVSHAH